MPIVTDTPATEDREFRSRIQTAWYQSKYRDYTQKELAALFNYSQQGMSFILNGHRYPHLSAGIKIAKAFNVTLDWLYTGRLPMRPLDPSPFIDLTHRLVNLTQPQVKVMGWILGLLENGQLNEEALRDLIMESQSLDVNSLVKG